MLKNNKIFKTSDLQKLDKYTIENEPVTSLDLMERAATVFTEKLLIFFPNNHIFNILAGFGNNGGDGYFPQSYAGFPAPERYHPE